MSVVALAGVRAPMFFPTYDEGRSETAQELNRSLSDVFGASAALSSTASQSAETKLVDAVVAARREGMTVNSKSVDTALGFLWLLPANVPTPEMVIEPDGEVAFDWDEGRGRVLSISMSDSGTVGYAGLIGLEPVYGRAPFAGTIPETVLYLLTRLYPSDAPTDFRQRPTLAVHLRPRSFQPR